MVFPMAKKETASFVLFLCTYHYALYLKPLMTNFLYGFVYNSGDMVIYTRKLDVEQQFAPHVARSSSAICMSSQRYRGDSPPTLPC